MDKNNVLKTPDYSVSYAPGKVILVGEHAVVYGARAIAAPIDVGIRVAITALSEPMNGLGPTIKGLGSFGLGEIFLGANSQGPESLKAVLRYLVDFFGSAVKNITIIVDGSLPRGHGLGSSAAFSVALIKAIFNYFSKSISKEELVLHAHNLETIFHGRPSGIDHTVVINEDVICFKKNQDINQAWPIELKEPLSLVVGLSGPHDGTKNAVQKLQNKMQEKKRFYEYIFAGLDEIATQMESDLKEGALSSVGELMNMAHGYLSALGVSTGDLDRLVAIAKERGALGAKLTGAGGGGAVIALANGNEDDLHNGFMAAGFMAFKTKSGLKLC